MLAGGETSFRLSLQADSLNRSRNLIQRTCANNIYIIFVIVAVIKDVSVNIMNACGGYNGQSVKRFERSIGLDTCIY